MDDLTVTSSALDHLVELGRQLGDIPREQAIRDFLGGYNFQGDKVLDPVSSFSGGEKARLALALIAWTRPNLLLMDEPTNHLDLEMRQALTVALQAFSGAIVLVSHDQHLMANSVDQFLLVESGQTAPFSGDLADYRTRVLPKAGTGAKKPATEVTATSPASAPASPKRPGRETRQLKTRLNTVNTRLERLQRKLSEVEDRLADPAIYDDRDNPELQSLIRDQLSLKEEIEPLEEEWLELSEQLEAS
jgi:ATP-binding cassette subfamily F protein 3